jgi:signal transduction histidine kinase
LRAPLRAMEGFSETLVAEAGPNFSKTGKDLANRISVSAQFMDAMLRDLLTYSRVSQERIELSAVNLEMSAQKQVFRLKTEIEQKNAEIEILGSWPPVLGHERTLGHVLSNLLSNALKFAKPNVPPLIRLRAEELTDSPLPLVKVWVEDNGIGIEPRHQEQTFRLFTRLHGDQFPGTGFGLAIVQKGIERMGGRVGVESTVGEGSRFWFELRKA